MDLALRHCSTSHLLPAAIAQVAVVAHVDGLTDVGDLVVAVAVTVVVVGGGDAADVVVVVAVVAAAAVGVGVAAAFAVVPTNDPAVNWWPH